MPVSRFSRLAGIPERTYRRRLARHRAGDPSKGPWPAPKVDDIEATAAKYAVDWPVWGHRKIAAMMRADGHLERIREAVSDRGRGVRRRGERPPTRGAPKGTDPNKKGTTIMKLTTTTHVSVDGVMQGLGAPDEDRSGGFERGGWAIPLFDNEAATFLNQVYGRADAFLFGRRTYEIFAGYWGTIADPDNPIAGPLNTRPKYVASTTLTDPKWSDTTVLSDDLATAIADLKAKPGGELQVHGSGALIRWLLDNQLVDEITLFVYPVVLGQGTRLFPDTGPDAALDLVESRSTPKGITIQVYRPTGRPQYETATPTPST